MYPNNGCALERHTHVHTHTRSRVTVNYKNSTRTQHCDDVDIYQ